MASRGKLSIFACDSGRPFAEKIAKSLNDIIFKEQIEGGAHILNTKESHFANSEVKEVIDESVRGHDIFIVQDIANSVTDYSVDTNFRALKTAIDAAYKCDADYITAVIPVFPYARQDKAFSREGITAAQVAREIEDAGADRVITLDIHNEAIAGFFRRARFDNLRAAKSIIDFFKSNVGTENLTVASPDAGGVPRANHYAQKLGADLAIVYKKRDYSKENSVKEAFLLGNVEDRNVLFVDDMIDTAGTLVTDISTIRSRHRPNKIYYACSLPIFSRPKEGKSAVQKLRDAYEKGDLNLVIGTDAVYHGGENFLKENLWYREVSLAKYFAKVILNVNRRESLSQLLS
ncbi:MAG: ribose-phosphate pyrophosphokinase [Candidatus Woesearchaeota archaeon]|nr:ribose-phosphate pyrophosphokinase [Candidatus Woesearchaeota archaeon]